MYTPTVMSFLMSFYHFIIASNRNNFTSDENLIAGDGNLFASNRSYFANDRNYFASDITILQVIGNFYK